MEAARVVTFDRQAALEANEASAAEPDTATLVERARQGDERAYEAVYRRYVGRVYALSLRMCGDAQMAEEITQDTFVKAWRGLERFRGDSRFTTWLHRITVNLVLQNRRSLGRRAAREEVTEDVDGLGHWVRPAEVGKKIDLERAIGALPEGARDVLVLRDVQGYKYREVADMLGVAVGTVKAQVHRARRMVQETLER